MAYGTILLIVIFAIIGGIIIGALSTILNIMWNERKAKREFKEGKAFEVKKTPTQIIKKKKPKKPPIPILDEKVLTKGDELKVPKPEEEIKDDELEKDKDEKERTN